MNYYFPVMAGTRDRRSISYFVSSRNGESYPWPEGSWIPSKELIYMAYQDVPTFSNDVRKELPKVILVVRPKVEELPDVIGQFSFNPAASPPLLRRPLVELIQRDYPGCCEFIQAGKIWDDVFKRELDGSQYFFSNVVKTIDSWDPDLSDVRQLSRKDGSVYFALAGSGVLNAEAVNGAHIWRDAKTMHVLCSEEFREKAEAVGASNMHFYRVDVSA